MARSLLSARIVLACFAVLCATGFPFSDLTYSFIHSTLQDLDGSSFAQIRTANEAYGHPVVTEVWAVVSTLVL
jgi:hypothetical protein